MNDIRMKTREQLENARFQLEQAVAIVDLVRIVSTEEGRKLATRHGLDDDTLTNATWSVELMLNSILERVHALDAELAIEHRGQSTTQRQEVSP